MAQTPSWMNILGQQGGANPWTSYSGAVTSQPANRDWVTALYNAGLPSAQALTGAAPAAAGMGYGNLLGILAGQGRTDPRMLNSLLSQVQQNTQGAQQQVQGMAARQGFQNSGVNAALQAALGQAGTTRQSDLLAQEAQMAEQRKRQDLGLFMDMILNPSRDYTALSLGQYNADKDRQQQGRNARTAMIGQLLGGLGGIFGAGV